MLIPDPRFSFLRLLHHPLSQILLSELRDKETPPAIFRDRVQKITQLMTAEILQDLVTSERTIEGPFGQSFGWQRGEDPVIVAILRAGQGMVEGVLHWLPNSPIGYLGYFRDKDNGNQATAYLCQLPKGLAGQRVLLLDPLLATGNTAVAAIAKLREHQAKSIQLLTVLASERGLKAVHASDPQVQVITVCVDPKMNDHDYLIPGLGDAGDRLFGTF
jgi:uracil phosphoribosyltransferase